MATATTAAIALDDEDEDDDRKRLRNNAAAVDLTSYSDNNNNDDSSSVDEENRESSVDDQPFVIDLTGSVKVSPREMLALEYAWQEKEDAARAEAAATNAATAITTIDEATRLKDLQWQYYRRMPPLVTADQMCQSIHCLGCRYHQYWTEEIVTRYCRCKECRRAVVLLAAAEATKDDDLEPQAEAEEEEPPVCVRTYCIGRPDVEIPVDILVEMERVWNNLYQAKVRDGRWQHKVSTYRTIPLDVTTTIVTGSNMLETFPRTYYYRHRDPETGKVRSLFSSRGGIVAPLRFLVF
jgi:hypothetical protein